MTYSVTQTPRCFVDHAGLEAMRQYLSSSGRKAALVGFGEYAKHLINLHPENVVSVVDPRQEVQGITFRDKPVIAADGIVDANCLVVCEYSLAYEFLGILVRRYSLPFFVANSIADKSTVEINAFEQEAFYKELFTADPDIPPSMMNEGKLKFLIELLRFGLRFGGNVVEMGCWQGGSTWYLAKALALLDKSRILYAMDLFETHVVDPTATMCTEEIRRKLTKQHAQTELLVGLIDDPANLAKISGKLCFAHIDLGPIPKAMEFVWDQMSLGAPIVLDNYGHVQAPTWEFDAFFEERGTRVVRLPWSEQGIVFKS